MNVNQEIIQQSIRFQESKISTTSSESISALLNALFPEQIQEEKEIKQVKNILGELGSILSIDEIHTITTEIQYLTTAWLDVYEKTVFKGKTLREILNEG